MKVIGLRRAAQLAARVSIVPLLALAIAAGAAGCSRTENGGPPVLAKKFPGGGATPGAVPQTRPPQQGASR